VTPVAPGVTIPLQFVNQTGASQTRVPKAIALTLRRTSIQAADHASLDVYKIPRETMINSIPTTYGHTSVKTSEKIRNSSRALRELFETRAIERPIAVDFQSRLELSNAQHKRWTSNENPRVETRSELQFTGTATGDRVPVGLRRHPRTTSLICPLHAITSWLWRVPH